MRVLLLLAAVALVVLGGAAGWYGSRELEDTETVTQTTTVTTTAPAAASGLPVAVERTRAALLSAAESGDYEELRPLVPETAFE